MKKQNLLFIIFLFSFMIIGYGQPLENDDVVFGSYIKQSKLIDIPSYDETYLKLKELNFNRRESEIYKKVEELSKAFGQKLNLKTFSEVERLNPQFSQWILENLELTSFKDIEEATAQYEEYLEASNQEFKENKDFHIYLFAVLDKFGPEIYSKVLTDYEIEKIKKIEKANSKK